jgi:hypothetical protein
MFKMGFARVRLAASLCAAGLIVPVLTAQNGPPLPPAENRIVDGSGNNLHDPTLGAPISLLERLDYSGIPGINGNNAYPMAFRHPHGLAPVI